jgi:formylglycine-generating enzyme required for sulfatase activity
LAAAGFVCGMKMNWKLPVFLAISALFSSLFGSDAQSLDTIRTDTGTNAPPTLAELMTTNDVVTNTVGIVLLKISSGFWAGKYEVTQSAYQKVMDNNPSTFKGGDNPVDSVSWDDATAFCSKLTEKEKSLRQLPTGYSYSLPTETQWESLVGDASLDDAIMSLNGNFRSSTASVGSLKPNSLGLYDTRGNVMEWCLDSHDPAYHVLRGGAWNTSIEPNSRIVFRWYGKSDEATNTFGFRVVLEQGQ